MNPLFFLLFSSFYLILTTYYIRGSKSSQVIDLSTWSSWTITNSKYGLTLYNVTIPGGIYSDLMKAQIISSDLYARFNDEEFRWISKENWNYSLDFTLSKSFVDKSSGIQIHFEGLDTITEIWLNGILLGKTTNMFIEYWFDVQRQLIAGQNNLRLLFLSPVIAARQAYEAHRVTYNYSVKPDCVPPEYHGECHVNFIRKMQSSFGWDWGPAFPSMGIWKPIYIHSMNSPKIQSVQFNSVHIKESYWKILLKVRFRVQASTLFIGSLTIDLNPLIVAKERITRNSSSSSLVEQILEFKYRVKGVERWWPNSYGNQTLYTLKVDFQDDKTKIISTWSGKIGFRTIELIEESVQPNGLSFYFRINQVNMFMKGSNWIPSHILPELSNEENVYELLYSAKEAHMVMLRVWGGGIYESNRFYEICDSLGLLIWQDLMYACSMYPTNPQNLKDAAIEISQQIHRLQYHSSIALWGGNNENEAALFFNWYSTDESYDESNRDYKALYTQTLSVILKKEDPFRSFLISSPSNSKGESLNLTPYSSLFGDTHFYDYDSDTWNSGLYPKARFVSEFGFQSFADISILRASACDPEDLESINSRFLIHRQHHYNGYTQLEWQISLHLDLPSKYNSSLFLKKFISLSQITQAMALKTAIEAFRRQMSAIDSQSGEGLTMGALYWQLNDIWPTISWSSLNYGGQWKMSHYAIEKAFRPNLLTISLVEKSIVEIWFISDEINRNNETYTLVIDVQKWNSFSKETVLIKKNVRHIFGSSLLSSHPLTSLLQIGNCRGSQNAPLRLEYCLISARLLQESECKAENHLFSSPKSLTNYYKTSNPLRIQSVNESFKNHERPYGKIVYKILLSSNSVALFVWLDVQDISGRFTNNFFLMSTPSLEIEFWPKRNTSLEEVKDKLSVCSYIDFI